MFHVKITQPQDIALRVNEAVGKIMRAPLLQVMKNELEKCEILPAPHSASENLASHSYAISNSFESVRFFF